MGIEKVSVFVDPFQEVEDELKKQREEELAKASEELKAIAKPVEKKQKTFSSGVGKYINPAVKKEAKRAVEPEAGPSTSKSLRLEATDSKISVLGDVISLTNEVNRFLYSYSYVLCWYIRNKRMHGKY